MSALKFMAFAAILLGASACGDTWGQRAVTGGAIGAGSHAGMAACATMDEVVARLLRLQERIAAELRSPEANGGGGPRAVVTIAAGDFDKTVQEAVAVVEAMV